MKCALGLAFLVLLAVSAFGQTSRTDIHGYYIGETFPQFSEQSGFDLSGCSGGKKLSKPEKKGCKDAADAQSGKKVVEDISPRDSNSATPQYHFLFEGGKLVLVTIHLMDFSQALADATAKYGPPTKQETISVQNGYGATWNEGYARWNMPDAVVITAEEWARIDSVVGFLRSTDITFRSADKQKEYDAIFKRQRNPF